MQNLNEIKDTINKHRTTLIEEFKISSLRLSGSKFEEPARPRAAVFGTWTCLTPRKLDLLSLFGSYVRDEQTP